jgi:hypothetical protein
MQREQSRQSSLDLQERQDEPGSMGYATYYASQQADAEGRYAAQYHVAAASYTEGPRWTPTPRSTPKPKSPGKQIRDGFVKGVKGFVKGTIDGVKAPFVSAYNTYNLMRQDHGFWFSAVSAWAMFQFTSTEGLVLGAWGALTGQFRAIGALADGDLEKATEIETGQALIAATFLADEFIPGAGVVRAGRASSVAEDMAKAAPDAVSKPLRKLSCDSFAPATLVLLGDGTTKPIKDVKVGDEVIATDPVTGQTARRRVTALHRNEDTELTDLTVETGDGATEVIHTTQRHPFWDEATGAWEYAGNLTPGAPLRTTDQRTARVLAVSNRVGDKDMRNLTVDDLHTYYVVAGTVPVLVHNTGPCNSGNFPLDSFEHTEYSMDELAGMAYRHTGSGDMHVGGSAPRPTELEIRTTLSQGEASPYGGNSVQYVQSGIRVIINRDMPWQSTAYYIGK